MATERQRKDEPIPIIPCKVRDEPRWKLDTVSDGVRKRQFFASRADAVNARKAALQDRAALGKAWAILTAAQKAKLMHTVKEIEDKGYTIEHVWLAFQGMKNAPASVCTLRQAIAETIEAKRKANRRPGYVDGLEQYLNQFAKGRTATPISHFTAELIEQWFNGRGEAPETRNSNLGRLSAMFDLCWRRRYIAENPCHRVEKASVDSKTPRVLTLRQSARCILWARRRKPEFLAWMALALFAGVRPEAEGDNLDWSAFDLDRARLRVEGEWTKVRTHRIVDLNLSAPALARMVEGCKGRWLPA